jgi:tetratricopeptide (TPR) repeat protein
MARMTIVLVAVAAALMLAAGGCSRRERPSALYTLQQLETARAAKDPAKRIERLTIFIGNHEDSPYRFLAYREVLDTMVRDMKNEAGAQRYLSSLLAKETDPEARGELLLDKVSYLMEEGKQGTARAVAFVDTLMRTEDSPRLFLYLGYSLMDSTGAPGTALECFLKSADLARRPREKAQALAMAGACLEEQGKKGQAMRCLAMASGNPEADELMGNLLWEEGKRNEAIETYVRSAARMPGVRQYVKLDSLYALLHPGATDLNERILAARIEDEGPLPEGRFVDLEGRSYDLSSLKGSRAVLVALSPT